MSRSRTQESSVHPCGIERRKLPYARDEKDEDTPWQSLQFYKASFQDRNASLEAKEIIHDSTNVKHKCVLSVYIIDMPTHVRSSSRWNEWLVPESSDASLPSRKLGNLPALLLHFSEPRAPFLSSSLGNLSVDPRAVMTLSTKIAAPVKRFIFFVFLPCWLF